MPQIVEITALTSAGMPEPFTVASILTQTRVDGWLAAGLLIVAACYLYGVHRLRLRGDSWPIARTIFFLGPGLGSIALVTLSGIGAYDTTMVSVHMVQHMVLGMVAPIFLALGAPVTLALRTLPVRPRRVLLAGVHSRVAKVIAFPLVAFGIFVANPFVLYFTGLYEVTLRTPWLHEAMHAHFIATGCLFFWPLLGLDPLPGRWPHPGRALLMLLSVPFHTILGLTIMQQTVLLGGDYYPSLGLSWLDPAADQQLAGGILWAGGEVVSVTMLGVLVAQWMRHSEREARRIDRQLDREEEAAQRENAATPLPAQAPEYDQRATAIPRGER
ncbi:putative copper resistance protein D [Allocatelliglobosispora scoriae]|uniref:Putative copper resistance protein D n=1 Tax=Allocatelliglobosispora scoriae TaxID=643052 RepID=A0A841BRN9_9ACTN|nr:putative copper resistance protein D [Allocatelliglobosispora scoriae]